MNTLEANSIRTGKTDGAMVGMDILSKLQPSSSGPGRLDQIRSLSSFGRDCPKTGPHFSGSCPNTWRRNPVPSIIRYHLISNIGKPRRLKPPLFSHRTRNPAADATNGQAAALFSCTTGYRHAVRLARDL